MIFKTESSMILSLNKYVRTLGSRYGTLDNDEIVLRDDLDHLKVEHLHAGIAHVAAHAHSGKNA